MLLLLSACGPDIPQECGQNVRKVERIDFTGPGNVNEDGSGFDVTIAIEREEPSGNAIVCYTVRDDDGFFGIDDVLAANFSLLSGDATMKTDEDAFSLFNGNSELCGFGVVADENGCSGESESDIYLDVIGSFGDDSPKHHVRIQ